MGTTASNHPCRLYISLITEFLHRLLTEPLPKPEMSTTWLVQEHYWCWLGCPCPITLFGTTARARSFLDRSFWWFYWTHSRRSLFHPNIDPSWPERDRDHGGISPRRPGSISWWHCSCCPARVSLSVHAGSDLEQFERIPTLPIVSKSTTLGLELFRS